MRIYFTTPPAPQGLDSLRAEHQDWLSTFKSLRQASLAGQAWREQAARLSQRILSQLQHEEEKIYPRLDDFLLSQRPTREMLYEHQGIRHFLPQLMDALESTENNQVWERFSLDLIHLLEHHIEHEERGLYPVYERLLKEGKGP
jgi:hemerythrin-like domain-containing protein